MEVNQQADVVKQWDAFFVGKGDDDGVALFGNVEIGAVDRFQVIYIGVFVEGRANLRDGLIGCSRGYGFDALQNFEVVHILWSDLHAQQGNQHNDKTPQQQKNLRLRIKKKKKKKKKKNL